MADGLRLKTVALGGGGEIFRKDTDQGCKFHICQISERRGSGIFFAQFKLVSQHFAGKFIDIWEQIVGFFHLTKRFLAENGFTAVNLSVSTVVDGLLGVTLSTLHL